LLRLLFFYLFFYLFFLPSPAPNSVNSPRHLRAVIWAFTLLN
jgi:hypothetical protein